MCVRGCSFFPRYKLGIAIADPKREEIVQTAMRAEAIKYTAAVLAESFIAVPYFMCDLSCVLHRIRRDSVIMIELIAASASPFCPFCHVQ